MRFGLMGIFFALAAVPGLAIADVRPDIEIHPIIDCDHTTVTAQPDPSTGRPICISSQMILGGKDIVDVSDSMNSRGKHVLVLKMSDQATVTFAHFTEGWLGKQAALLIDGKLVSAPLILEPILGGVVQVDSLPEAQIVHLIERFKRGPPI